MDPMTHNDASINPAADLSDPADVAKQCEVYAGGLDQQSIASRSGTALGGHPYPEYFFAQAAAVMRAAAALIGKLAPVTNAKVPDAEPAPKSAPAPMAGGKK